VERCKSSQVPELTFVSFSYKRNGFASFATKRRIKKSLKKYS